MTNWFYSWKKEDWVIDKQGLKTRVHKFMAASNFIIERRMIVEEC